MSDHDLADEAEPLPTAAHSATARRDQKLRQKGRAPISKPQAQGRLRGIDPRVLIGGGAIAGLLVLFLVGLTAVRWISSGGQPAVADGVAIPDGNYVVIDSLAGGDAARVSIPTVFVAAPAAEPGQIGTRKPRAAAPREPSTESVKSSAARWSIVADPPREKIAYQYGANVRIPVETIVLGRLEMLPPVLADRGGPFAVPMPHWAENAYEFTSELIKTNKKRRHFVKEIPQAPASLIDLRTGEKVGEFSWKSSFWNNPRLSPGGTYLVGPDPAPYWLQTQSFPEIGKVEPNVLLVWKQKQETPAQKLAIPGVVLWAEFVSDDRLVLYLAGNKASLQVWDVSTGSTVTDIPLSIEPFTLRTDPAAGRWGYFPSRLLGAISPGGRYVAVGGVDGISVSSLADGREVGTLPITLGKEKHISEYRGVSFSPDGEELLALLGAETTRTTLRSWSVPTGTPLRELTLSFSANGALMPGPEPGTLMVGAYPFAAGSSTFLRSVLDREQSTFLIDATTGRALVRHPSIVRWSDSGPALALGPFPDGEAIAYPFAPSKKLPRIGIYPTDTVHAEFREACGKTDFGLARRPDPSEPDRTGVKTVPPDPPASWAPPPTLDCAAPPGEVAYLPDRPTSFGIREIAVIRTRGLQGSKVPALEVIWERHDALSGAPLGDPIQLWPWAWNPVKHPGAPEKPVAALSADDRMLAMRDPESPARLDVWTADGRRLAGFYASRPDARIEWLGWDRGGRLLTVADGILTSWEVPGAKAVYEVDGGYTVLVDGVLQRNWLALSAGTHVDLIDVATGRCLDRCAARIAGTILDLAVSPDGAKLAAVYLADPTAANRQTAANIVRAGRVNPTSDPMEATLVVWDLHTGRAEMLPYKLQKFALLHWGSCEL
ncbi:MAG: hypothetical protein ACM3U2_00640, partial [Deltaproteobacteria bacterium]